MSSNFVQSEAWVYFIDFTVNIVAGVGICLWIFGLVGVALLTPSLVLL